jgi:hypothetical protein
MNCQLFGTFLLMGVILTATSTSSAQPEESPEAMIERIELPLKVEPLEIRQGKGTGELKNGTPGWRGPVRLPRVAWVFRALTPGSLKVTLAEDPETVLEEGRDYLLDPDWAAIARAPESKYPEATKVAFEFQYTQSRLDLVEKGPGDQIRIRKGEEHMTAPVLPEPAEGWTPWASIYMPHNTTRVTEANLKRIDPEYDGVPPVLRGEKLDA